VIKFPFPTRPDETAVVVYMIVCCASWLNIYFVTRFYFICLLYNSWMYWLWCKCRVWLVVGWLLTGRLVGRLVQILVMSMYYSLLINLESKLLQKPVRKPCTDYYVTPLLVTLSGTTGF